MSSQSHPLPTDLGAVPVDPAERDIWWMSRALEEADRIEREDGEVPVAALIVDADNRVVARAGNRNIGGHDPTAHAEIVALRSAGQALANYRLPGLTMYVTLEPCAMCAMALVHARIARLVFAATDPKTGACGSVFDLIADPRLNHRVECVGGVLAEPASRRLSNYFRQKRGRQPLV